jgi:hypothetical protein
MRGILAFVSVMAVAISAQPAFTQAVNVTAEIKKGIQQVDDGEYDSAIVTLDGAVRRLTGVPGQTKELAQAYLYLGIAYLAKGHETSARERFREAVKQVRDLDLNPQKFAPRVIEAFERARQDVKQSPSSSAASPAKKEGGSGKLLLIGGGAAAVGAGAIVLLGASGEDDPNAYEYREGTLTGALASQTLPIGPGGAGPWKAELGWSNSSAQLKLQVTNGSTFVTSGRLISPTHMEAEWIGDPGATYTMTVGLAAAVASPTTFELNVTFPKP